ncbi:MAG: hydroxymethylpyrimidine/phosphomethylpyrimidine kinase [Actinotalea sp.]|nr:hydroxymethylpyrimidine/phosphomethylpyrimidine kinase [Actinotalea sp.]
MGRRVTRPPVVLSVAGSDPSGGAGIQGDLKTFAALGAYGTAVITALTAQSTVGVSGIHPVPPEFVRRQLDTLVADIPVDAIKIGMLGGAETVEAVTGFLAGRDEPRSCVVLDPVMVATTGARLLDEQAIAAMLELLPHVDVVTPNLPEAAALLGQDQARDLEEMIRQAHALRRLGARRVLLKGGHLIGPQAVDVWVDRRGEQLLHAHRVPTADTHGTGCALSSAVAALVPQRATVLDAVRDAKTWLTGTIAAADTLKLGRGAGPVHHFHEMWSCGPGAESARVVYRPPGECVVVEDGAVTA